MESNECRPWTRPVGDSRKNSDTVIMRPDNEDFNSKSNADKKIYGTNQPGGAIKIINNFN